VLSPSVAGTLVVEVGVVPFGLVERRGRINDISSVGDESGASSAFCSSASDARSSSPAVRVERILRGFSAEPLLPAAADTIASTRSAFFSRLIDFRPRADAIAVSCSRSFPSSCERSKVWLMCRSSR
jgi:hypothetical protein